MLATLRTAVIAAAGCFFISPSQALSDEKDVPPPDKWISVKNVSAEYVHIRGTKCKCGGLFVVDGQSTGEFKERHFDRVACGCRQCGARRQYVTSGIQIENSQRRSPRGAGDERPVRDRLIARNAGRAAQRSGLNRNHRIRHVRLISDKESIIIS